MRVALALLSFSGFAEAALRGVAAYARPNRPWTFDHGSQGLEGVNRMLAQKPDGILISTSDPRVAARISAARIPAVNLHYYDGWKDSFRVNDDHPAIGGLAAEYFLNRGYKEFAYFSATGERIDDRLKGFKKRLSESGHSCRVFRGGLPDPVADVQEPYERALSDWLQSLPQHSAVFCAHDHAAWVLAERCLRLNIAVPEQLGLLGVDNDTVICELADPPLSSIQTGAFKAGYEAAKLLDQMMAGQVPAVREVIVPPVRVVERRSTNFSAVGDKLVADVLAYMQAHLLDTEGIELMCGKFRCSRRTLERRFELALSMSPAHAWSRFRLEEGQRLLVETDLPLKFVAEASGFRDSRLLATAFKRFTGLTPAKFRQNARPQPARISTRDLQDYAFGET